MGHLVDFLESLLDDNVTRDYAKIVRQMSQHEAQSKISNQDYRHRLRHYSRATKRIQLQQMQRITGMRTKHK